MNIRKIRFCCLSSVAFDLSESMQNKKIVIDAFWELFIQHNAIITRNLIESCLTGVLSNLSKTWPHTFNLIGKQGNDNDETLSMLLTHCFKDKRMEKYDSNYDDILYFIRFWNWRGVVFKKLILVNVMFIFKYNLYRPYLVTNNSKQKVLSFLVAILLKVSFLHGNSHFFQIERHL